MKTDLEIHVFENGLRPNSSMWDRMMNCIRGDQSFPVIAQSPFAQNVNLRQYIENQVHAELDEAYYRRTHKYHNICKTIEVF